MRRAPTTKDGLTTAPPANLARLLLRWFEKAQRPLPWREAPTPYSVWVSEVMLQQTRVDTVVTRYRDFLTRFPTLEKLAKARSDEVLAAWSGLGYYRRARSLHEGARKVLAEHGGEFPRDLDEALALPGIGLYTAGAILSIAYNAPVPAVDGNVERVMSRILCLREDLKKSGAARQLRDTVRTCIPKDASSFNQALMELGATVCTPRNPSCTRCPVRAVCAAHKEGDPERYPQARRLQKMVPVTLHAAVVVHEGRYLLERVEGQFLSGMWLFPFAESRTELETGLERRFKGRCKLGDSLGHVRHAITFRRITLEAHLCAVPATTTLPSKRWRWVRREDLGKRVPVSSLAFKIAALLDQPF